MTPAERLRSSPRALRADADNRLRELGAEFKAETDRSRAEIREMRAIVLGGFIAVIVASRLVAKN